jgi:hypothetical protein
MSNERIPHPWYILAISWIFYSNFTFNVYLNFEDKGITMRKIKCFNFSTQIYKFMILLWYTKDVIFCHSTMIKLFYYKVENFYNVFELEKYQSLTSCNFLLSHSILMILVDYKTVILALCYAPNISSPTSFLMTFIHRVLICSIGKDFPMREINI